MRGTILLFLGFFLSSFGWQTDYEAAKAQAKKEQKTILLNFSGSDWNGPCKRLRKGLFSDTAFLHYAEAHLILVNIDFPKNMSTITEAQNRANEALADKYNPEGEFPYTLLLDKDENILEQWKGMISMKSSDFIESIQSHTASK